MKITAYDLASRFIGVKEIPGSRSNPMVLAMLRLDAEWPAGDEVPWCSAFTNYVAWLLRLPRSKALNARSWLNVGRPVTLEEARCGFDVVILSRGPTPQPGPEVIAAPGHVGFFGGFAGEVVMLLGGNQGDTVGVAPFPVARVLGLRRLHNAYD
jgi:uncharacterized protein (TIGR02594 family)